MSPVASDSPSTSPLELEPTEVQAWEDEDLAGAVLAEDVQLADSKDAAEMLEALAFRLPADIPSQELVKFARHNQTPLKVPLTADTTRYAYHLITVPLNIVVPPPQRLVRLRLALEFKPAEVVVWDMFPTDHTTQLQVKLGEFSLDVSKALSFISPAPIGDALGLKLKFPLGWTATKVLIDASGQMSNPAEWYVNDATITSAFVGYAIVRAPRGSSFSVSAELVGEVRRSSPMGWLHKARFRAKPRIYTVSSAGD